MTIYRWATDHRALVLEAVATCPTDASEPQIIKDCVDPEFARRKVKSMIWQLCKEGLIGRKEDGTYFITKTGLQWLAFGRFDKALPAPHIRPGARRKKERKS